MQYKIYGLGRKRMRRNISLVALATASCVGGLAVSAPAAQAAPMRATTPVIRNDIMAVVAAIALSDLQTSLVTGDRETRNRYVSTRNALAAEVANRLGLDPVLMQNAWSDADSQHQVALMAALSQLGVRYRRNMSAPGQGFDCSGLTAYAWSVSGTNIAHQSRTQINAAFARNADTAQAGDLMYFPGHVMMYLGVDKAILHAPNSGRTVEVGFVPAHRSVRFGSPIG